MDFVPVEPRPDRPAPGVSDRSLVDDGYAVITRVLPPQDVTPEPLPDGIV